MVYLNLVKVGEKWLELKTNQSKGKYRVEIINRFINHEDAINHLNFGRWLLRRTEKEYRKIWRYLQRKDKHEKKCRV